MFKMLQRKMHQEGVGALIYSIPGYLMAKVSPFSLRPNILRRRVGLSLGHSMEFKVAYGPFKGLEINPNFVWGKYDLASMLLGLYETEVISRLLTASQTRSSFIEIGSADGFYAAGVLKFFPFEKAIFFETTKSGRDSTLNTLRINQIDKPFHVLEEADVDFVRTIKNLGFDLSHSFILCDIEGGEFSLFTKENLDLLKDCIILIELHEFRTNQNEFIAFLESFEKNFTVELFRTGSRNLDAIKELNDMSDDVRWSLCSEGRRSAMQWLLAKPKC